MISSGGDTYSTLLKFAHGLSNIIIDAYVNRITWIEPGPGPRGKEDRGFSGRKHKINFLEGTCQFSGS